MPPTRPGTDSDANGMTDLEEANLVTNLTAAGTASDGMDDRDEVEDGTDSTRSDTASGPAG